MDNKSRNGISGIALVKQHMLDKMWAPGREKEREGKRERKRDRERQTDREKMQWLHRKHQSF